MLGSLLNYFASPSALRNAGVLGMNRRNHDYIAAYNKRKYYPMVDDKLITKELGAESRCADCGTDRHDPLSV